MRLNTTIACLFVATIVASSLPAGEAVPDSYRLPEKSTVIREKSDLVVTKVYRLTHPDYEIPHAFVLNHDPWNKDRKRIIFHEDNGRGPVWGYVDQLKRWRTKEEYLAAATSVFDRYVYKTYPAESIFWSPLDGEESVLYGLCTGSKQVIRIDVDRPAHRRITEIVSYLTGRAGATEEDRLANTAGSYAQGWTTDKRFTVVYADKKGQVHGGVFVDVKKGALSYFDKVPKFNKTPTKPSDNDAWRAFPYRSSQHSAISPSGKYYAAYVGSMGDGVWNTFDGPFIKDALVNFANPSSPVYPYHTQYVTWRASDDWYIATTLGDCECRLVDGKTKWLYRGKGDKPALWPNEIFQVYVDTVAGVCRYRKLLTYYTSGHWVNRYKGGSEAGKEFSVSNYHAHGISTLRNDGRQLVYCANENNYSFNDLRFAKAAGIDTAYMTGKVSGIGLFLVEFDTARK